jgi:hypothetical protein
VPFSLHHSDGQVAIWEFMSTLDKAALFHSVQVPPGEQ